MTNALNNYNSYARQYQAVVRLTSQLNQNVSELEAIVSPSFLLFLLFDLVHVHQVDQETQQLDDLKAASLSVNTEVQGRVDTIDDDINELVPPLFCNFTFLFFIFPSC